LKEEENLNLNKFNDNRDFPKDEDWTIRYLDKRLRGYIQPWIEYNDKIKNFNTSFLLGVFFYESNGNTTDNHVKYLIIWERLIIIIFYLAVISSCEYNIIMRIVCQKINY